MNPRILLVWLLLLLAACGNETTDGQAEQAAAPVRLAVATIGDIPQIIESVGYVAASSSVAIRSRITGELMEVRFTEGDDISEGQILFVLDERPFAAALREAQARLQRDRAQMLKAREDMRRFQNLASRGFASQEQFEQARTDATALEATVQADEAAVELRNLELAYCTIRSPIKGRAGVVVQNKGNLIKANDEIPMLTIDCFEPVYVYFSVSETHLAAIRRQAASRHVTVSILAQGAPPEQTVSGALSFIDNSVDMRTGAIRLRTEYPNAERSLWPGQFASVRLRLGEHKQVLTVPSAAVLNGPAGAYVYTVDAENRAQYRAVQPGVEYEELTVITEGLADGERVVTEGHVRLGPNMPVHDINDPHLATPGAPAGPDVS
jgi:multidrug efflux system membrane fusion protein